VDIEKRCYDDHNIEDLKMMFKNCDPHPRDWIGIYETSLTKDLENTQEFGSDSSSGWQYTCGSQHCDYKKGEGTLHFKDIGSNLKNGEYRAYLFKQDSYHLKVQSQSFKIGNCNGWNKEPTQKPTSSFCHRPSSVKVDRQCYKDHQPSQLKVFFENCDPKEKDWIAIYKAHSHKNYVSTNSWWGESYIWKFTCGSQKCNYKKDEGTLYFDNWWSSLDDGAYKAYLFRNNGYHVKAESETFKVGDSC